MSSTGGGIVVKYKSIRISGPDDEVKKLIKKLPDGEVKTELSKQLSKAK